MSKVLLISANNEDFPAPVYPLGLALLAGSVEKAGHIAYQYDILASSQKRIVEILNESNPDIIGISIRNIDNIDSSDSHSYIDSYRSLIQSIRKQTSVPIVLGGSGFSLFPEILLEYLDADIGIVGPGEDALVELLETPLDSLSTKEKRLIKSLNGGVSNNENNCQSNNLFVQAKHDSNLLDFYWRKGGMIGIMTKRGCPNRCSYCTYPLIQGHDIQWADPAEIAEQMLFLKTNHDITYFFFLDSVFNLCEEREVDLAEEIIRRDIRCHWGGFFSPRGITKEYLTILRRSGLRHVEFGTDALAEQTLISLRKGYSVDDVIQASSCCSDLRLFCAHYLIMGGPRETEQTVRECMKNTLKLGRSVIFPFVGVRIYPGTQIHEIAIKEGTIKKSNNCLEPLFYVSPEISSDSMWYLIEELKGKEQCWIYPQQYEKIQPLMQQLREDGVKGLLWEFA